jgi:hypothetical protein
MSSSFPQGLDKDLQASSSSTPNVQAIFEQALEEYNKKTGNDLAAHPLADMINGCDSPKAIFPVLERQANELTRSRNNDQRLTEWLIPTVIILNALPAILGEDFGSVSYQYQAASFPAFAQTLTFRYLPLRKLSFPESVFSSL